MTDAQRVVEALQEMLEEAEGSVAAYGEERDVFFARGIRQALSKARSIAEGF